MTTNELKKMDCKAPISCGFGDGTEERGVFIVNPKTGKVEEYVPAPPPEVDAPVFHKDEYLDGIHSMADDKIYYSKSEYKKSLKKLGYEITGGDHLQVKPKIWKSKMEDIRDDAEKAYYDIKYDRVEISEKSKQLNIEEERQWKAYKNRQK